MNQYEKELGLTQQDIVASPGIHYMSLERNVILPGGGLEHAHVENKNAAEKESSGTTATQLSVKDEQEKDNDIQKTKDSANNSNKNLFELLPDFNNNNKTYSSEGHKDYRK